MYRNFKVLLEKNKTIVDFINDSDNKSKKLTVKYQSASWQ